MSRHRAKPWREAYSRDSCRTLLSGGWLEKLDAARAGTYAPPNPDADQLLKHALGLQRQHGHRGVDVHLVYVYWAPLNGDDLTEVRAHREELQAFRRACPRHRPWLHTISDAQLLEQSEFLTELWAAEHLSGLRQLRADGHLTPLSAEDAPRTS